MTVDDIHRVYDDAYKQYQREPVNGGSAERAERFALCSVVRALRDEIFDARGNASYGSLAIYDLFNSILGDAGAEKVAGAVCPQTGPLALLLEPPATVAAPADVCVWLDDGNPRKRRRNSCGLQGANQSWAGMNWVCTGCLKPIKFTEAK